MQVQNTHRKLEQQKEDWARLREALMDA